MRGFEHQLGVCFGRSQTLYFGGEERYHVLLRAVVVIFAVQHAEKVAVERLHLGIDFVAERGPVVNPVELAGPDGFAHQFECEVGVEDAGVLRLELFEHVAVFGLVLGPGLEGLFVLLFARHGVQTRQTQRFALPFFPGVRDAGVDRRVHDAHGGIFLLRRIDPIEPFGADTDFHRVAAVHDVIDRVGEDVLLGVAREAVDHREVAFLNTFGGDLEMFFRAVGYVVGRVGRRPVVFIRIDAEHREVARVPGPCPVVGVAAELADRRGRSAYQADIVELFIDEQELLVAVVHLLDRGFVAAVLAGFFEDFLAALAGGQTLGDVLHAFEELDVEVFVGKLLFARLCPEAVG